MGQNLTSQVLKLAENDNDSRAGGGGCFGDSGGPVFHEGYLVGDTSFGGSQYCSVGNGGYYRLDTADARSFLDDFVSVPWRATDPGLIEASDLPRVASIIEIGDRAARALRSEGTPG